MTSQELQKKALSLPMSPGVYIMKNVSGDIIYIGKAKALKNRVSSYFTNIPSHTVKVYKMIINVNDFDYIVTGSEFEALVLECSLIKQNKPKYNILLKDDKGYSYIKITAGDCPKISECKRKDDDGSTYLGPYMSDSSVKISVDDALKIYKLPRCNKKFPESFGKYRPCLDAHIGLCAAPCAKGGMTREEYRLAAADAVAFLKGDDRQSVNEMQKRMQQYSDDCEFEKAAVLRDRIKAIKTVTQRQNVVDEPDSLSRDVIACAYSGTKACVNIMSFRSGKLTSNEYFFCDCDETPAGTESEIIKRFYSSHDDIPQDISTDIQVSDADLLSRWLSEKSSHRCTFSVPVRGRKQALVSLSKRNAEEKLRRSGTVPANAGALSELAQLLGLEKVPSVIESCDISHTAGTDPVGVIVVYRNGMPWKAGYKRFKIRDAAGGDDPAAVFEVFSRRFEHWKNNDESFLPLPDLILADGGRAQLESVLRAEALYGLNIPAFGMVKDSKHRTRAVCSEDREVEISDKREAFTLVSSIQEEVHRYAINYHKTLRSGSMVKSEIEQIPGIGPKKREKLMQHFKTVDAVSAADADTLCSVPGITAKDARCIYNFYHIDKNK
jgi:excinuclease ABC subunit C